MSDEEDYDYDDDEDNNSGSEQSDNENDQEIEIENNFLDAEDNFNTDKEKSLEQFLFVIKKEEEYRGNTLPQSQEYIFKSLKFSVILMCNLQKPADMIQQINKLLEYMKVVARNEATDAITILLDNLVKLQDQIIMKSALELILNYLEQNNMDQLLNKAYFRLSYIYFDVKDYKSVRQTLDKIFSTNRNPDGTDNPKKITQLLECYALEIQLFVIHNQPIKKILKRVTALRNMEQNSIIDQRIMGIIQENTGRMYMKQRKYMDANQEFQESFKAYQDIGSSKAKQVLKYWSFASILGKSEMNPFDEQSTQAYNQDSEIQAMKQLREAYQQDNNPNVKQFKNILEKRENHISDDEFLSEYTNDLKKTICLKKIITLVNGYEKIKMKYIAYQILNNEKEVERFLMELINSEQVDGSIDSSTGVFVNYSFQRNPIEKQKLANIQKWITTINSN